MTLSQLCNMSKSYMHPDQKRPQECGFQLNKFKTQILLLLLISLDIFKSIFPTFLTLHQNTSSAMSIPSQRPVYIYSIQKSYNKS